MTYKEKKKSSTKIAYDILKREKRAMKPAKLIEIAVKKFGLVMKGKTPHATLCSNFINERKRRDAKGRKQRFVRISRGKWGLVEYVGKFYDIE